MVEYAVDVCACDCVFSSCLAVDCMYVHLAVIGDIYDMMRVREGTHVSTLSSRVSDESECMTEDTSEIYRRAIAIVLKLVSRV